MPRVAVRRAEVVEALEREAGPLRLVNGGGTGSLATTSREEAVTEVTVGSGFYAPALFDHYAQPMGEAALFFALEVVRRPRPTTFTCAGGGFIASGATGATKQPVPTLPPGGRLDPNEGAGEVQTPVHFETPPLGLSIGSPVFSVTPKPARYWSTSTRLRCWARMAP